MPRFIPCDYKGQPLEKASWSHIPEPSPFPHEVRYYTKDDMYSRILRLMMEYKDMGIKYCLREREDGNHVLCEVYKLHDSRKDTP